MAESKADILLHPIRMRSIQTLIGGAHRTTQQIAEMMPDVPQATLYRHLNKLLQAKVIEVAKRQQVRGTTEKVYALNASGGEISLEELRKMSPEEHMELFMKFVASLIGDFGKYVGQPQYDLYDDGVSFRQVDLHLTDEEYMQMLLESREQLKRYVGNEPRADRRRRTIVSIVIPEPMRSKEDSRHDNDSNAN